LQVVNSHYSFSAKKLDLRKIAGKSSFMMNKSSFRSENRVSQFSAKSSFTQTAQKISLQIQKKFGKKRKRFHHLPFNNGTG